MLHKKTWRFSADCRPCRLPLLRKRLLRTLANFYHNQQLLATGSGVPAPINGQKHLPAAALRYGRYPFSWNGCEIIAVYNSLLFLGQPLSPAQIALEFERNHLYLLLPSCVFGTHPKRLRRFLAAHRIPFTACFSSLDAFTAAYEPAQHTCGILSFWNNRRSLHRFNFFGGGLHTVAFRMQESGVLVYNRFARDPAPVWFPSLEALLADRRFLSGYWL